MMRLVRARRQILGLPTPAGTSAGLFSAPAEWPLWPGRPPGAPPTAESDHTLAPTSTPVTFDPGIFVGVGRPSMFVYPSSKPSGGAILLFPGGGYVRVAIGTGSGEIARHLNREGFAVFILKYRLPSGRWAAGPDATLQDAQRAMRLIRANAARLAIDPSKIIALGFSAGGHGAASLVARSSAELYEPIDHADSQSARPDLAGLMFPVIALDRAFAHPGSREALFNTDVPPDVRARYSPDLHVTPSAPPTFLAHAADDHVVPVENSLAMFSALRAAQVATELHLFEQGDHGLRVEGEDAGARSWMKLFLTWCGQHGVRPGG